MNGCILYDYTDTRRYSAKKFYFCCFKLSSAVLFSAQFLDPQIQPLLLPAIYCHNPENHKQQKMLYFSLYFIKKFRLYFCCPLPCATAEKLQSFKSFVDEAFFTSILNQEIIPNKKVQ
jgi:hypothetical protein